LIVDKEGVISRLKRHFISRAKLQQHNAFFAVLEIFVFVKSSSFLKRNSPDSLKN
jgi:hypothetical protein